MDPLNDGISEIKLIDIMGNDSSIVQAARVSYGKGTKTLREDAGLIRYLMQHEHMTPFEMCEYKFYIKCPVFVMRQMVRHRTASINEYSQRYSEVPEEFYIPAEVRRQATVNRQGSGDIIDELTATNFTNFLKNCTHIIYKTYISFLERGVSRETARLMLGLNTYTQFYWKVNLRNLLHFIKLRLDSHAQWEIRQYAKILSTYVKEQNPLAWEAFREYSLDAVTLSRGEVRAIRTILNEDCLQENILDYFEDQPSLKTLRKRKLELLAKLQGVDN